MHSAADNGSAPRRKLLAAWRRMIARDCRFRSALGRPFTRAFVPRSHRPRLSLPFDARYFSSSSVFCWRYCITTRGACQGGKINFSKKFFRSENEISQQHYCIFISSRIARRASLNPPMLSISPWETASFPSSTVPISLAMRSERIIMS